MCIFFDFVQNTVCTCINNTILLTPWPAAFFANLDFPVNYFVIFSAGVC